MRRSYFSLWHHETPERYDGGHWFRDLPGEGSRRIVISSSGLKGQAVSNKILFHFGLKPKMGYYNTLLGVRRQFHSQGHFLVLVHTFWFFSVEWGRVWESTRASPHCALDPGWKGAQGSAHTHTGLGTGTYSLHLQCCCNMELGQMVDISICTRF